MSDHLTPAQYAILNGATLYQWQIEALEAVGNGWPTSLVTCNGAGKTAEVAARAVAWFFYRHPKGKLVATSGSFNQLQNQLWPAIKAKLREGFTVLNGAAPCVIRSNQGGTGVGFSTKDAGRAEGWHPTISGDVDPVFILVDEAKTVPNDIFEAFDRCTVAYSLYISSPGRPSGRFYESQHKLSGYYYRRKVSSVECPHIDPAKRERDREILGEDSPTYKSMHLAEFTDLDGETIVSPLKLRQALDHQPEESEGGEKVAFVDFAAGGDENVIYVRRGNRVRMLAAWKDRDTVQTARKVIRILSNNGYHDYETWCDADGLGLPLINQMEEEGFHPHRWHGGRAAQDSTNYLNAISEAWIVSARDLVRGRYNVGELDAETVEQITGRRLEWDDKSRLRAEPKEKMRKRGLHSPDRGDALFGCIYCGSHLTGSITAERAEESSIPENGFEAEAGFEF